MKQEIKVPRMGESISEATIGNILKSSGSQVRAEEEILELETDKVNQVLYAPAAGVLQLSVKTGDTVQIGQTIGTVDADAKAEKSPAPATASAPAAPTPPAPQKKAEAAAKATEGAPARMMKDEFVAELKSETPVAPKPKVAVSKMAEPVVKGERGETRKKMTRIRRVIAERLVESLQTSAMLTTFNEVDMSAVIDVRTKNKEEFTKKYNARLGFMPFFVKAVVMALKAFPELNSYIDGDDVVQRSTFDIGIAVGTERGLVVPVVRNCDTASFGEIEQQIEHYATLAREGGLTVDDLQGGSFTITNGGTYGSLLSTPILNPPQCGILGMHKIQKRAVVVDDLIMVRPMMYVALSYDHRLVDGKGAVGFLVHVKEHLEDPSRILLDI